MDRFCKLRARGYCTFLEKQILWDTEDEEQAARGGWRRIFPASRIYTSEGQKYSKKTDVRLLEKYFAEPPGELNDFLWSFLNYRDEVNHDKVRRDADIDGHIEETRGI